MLTQQHIDTVKSTIPLLESAGPAITKHFYQRMFEHNPELKDIFNMSHQKTGGQPVALFNAIAAYAKHIETPQVLMDAVERIAQKHTSFNIQPAQYSIVGHHLIETLRELAGDAFTPAVEEAWGEAYNVLANIFIDREGELYALNAAANGGWIGAREFVLTETKAESELVKSLIFKPVDGLPVMTYKPGQYIGIEVKPSTSDYQEIRQYSLSDKANGEYYRISVKREAVGIPGVVSNFLHDELAVGDEVILYPPAGDFFFVDRNAPVVLVSAGVGVTPMQAMLETLSAADYNHPIHYIHACENVAQLSFAERLQEIQQKRSFHQHIFLRETANDEAAQAIEHHTGLLNLAAIQEQLPLSTGDYYLCGPVTFMQFAKQQLLELGVNNERIHYEVFGPHKDL